MITISVEPQDIEGSEVGNPRNCALGRAIKRTVGGCQEVFIGFKSGRIILENGRLKTFGLTKIAREMVARQDEGIAIEPYRCELPI